MTSQHTSTPADSTLKECAHKSASDVLGTLETLVRIPSLSLPGSDPDVLSHSAQTVKSLLETVLPWDSIEIVQASEGAPAIIAHKVAEPGFPTVLLYAHHDVQPAGDAQLWESPPFEPDVREGRLYGRGSADDGAGIAVHLHSLAAVHEACEGSVPLGVTVFIEGEEESGSPTFTSLLERYRDLLQADLIIVADSDNPDPAIPGLTTSLRGVVGVTVGVRMDVLLSRLSTRGSTSTEGMRTLSVASQGYSPGFHCGGREVSTSASGHIPPSRLPELTLRRQN
jgi:acetylornithine deacetylase/succinyl-diaminopimelate desuccinylase-like protein